MPQQIAGQPFLSLLCLFESCFFMQIYMPNTIMHVGIPNYRAGIRVSLRQHYTRRNISLRWYQTVGIRIFLRQHYTRRNISLLWYQTVGIRIFLRQHYTRRTISLLWYQTVGTRARMPRTVAPALGFLKTDQNFLLLLITIHLLFNW